MKQKSVIKILLDIILTVLYLLLMFDFGTGAFFHETAGILIGVLFAFHVVLNIKPICGLLRNAAAGRLPPLQWLLLIGDCILPFGMLLVIGTGIAISTELFAFSVGSAWNMIFTVHDVASYVCLGILGLHLVLHARYLYNVIRQIVRRRRDTEVKRAFGAFAAGALTICFLYVAVFAMKNSDALAVADQNKSSEQSSPDVSDSTSQILSSDDSPAVSSSAASSLPENSYPADSGSSAQESTISQPQQSGSSSDDKTSVTQSTVSDESTPTLAQYLGSLHCTGCGKHCLLSNPRCGRGQQQATEAKTEYQSLYGAS